MKHSIHLLADRIWRSSQVSRPFLPVSSQVQVLEFTERKASNLMLITGSIPTKKQTRKHTPAPPWDVVSILQHSIQDDNMGVGKKSLGFH